MQVLGGIVIERYEEHVIEITPLFSLFSNEIFSPGLGRGGLVRGEARDSLKSFIPGLETKAYSYGKWVGGEGCSAEREGNLVQCPLLSLRFNSYSRP